LIGLRLSALKIDEHFIKVRFEIEVKGVASTWANPMIAGVKSSRQTLKTCMLAAIRSLLSERAETVAMFGLLCNCDY